MVFENIDPVFVAAKACLSSKEIPAGYSSDFYGGVRFALDLLNRQPHVSTGEQEMSDWMYDAHNTPLQGEVRGVIEYPLSIFESICRLPADV